jgi:ElaB/YqjD/DUF883 family membrane-anchored ribosome-binding protein
MNRENIDIDTLTREELERELQRVLEEIDDLNDMQQAVLGQTGIHIGVVLLQKYRSRFDRDLERFNDRVVRIRARLAMNNPERVKRQDE